MINKHIESTRCLLCVDAPCTKACPKGLDPAKGVRSIRFDNEYCAGQFFNQENCLNCDAPCEKACIHYDFPLRIKELASDVTKVESKPSADLSIDFCGFHCENPFILASSVIGNCYEMIAKAFDQGWAGVSYKTISFLDIKEVSPRFDQVEMEGMPFLGFRNMEQLSEHSPESDFETIGRLKKDYPTKLVIASIMGKDEEEWAKLAQMAEAAGADMVECNFSCPQMKSSGLGSDIGQNPELVRLYTMAVKNATKLPVIIKMTPNITHIEEPALAAKLGGADAIAAINTIKSITLKHRSSVSGQKTVSGYSGKAVKPIAQRMILDIAKAPETKGIPLSGIGGVETWKDAIEYIRLGCTNIQVCTAIMQYGYRIIEDLTSGIQDYMQRHGVEHLNDIVGSSLPEFVAAGKLDRDTYVLPKFNKDVCIGCGRCSISCYDGGHQAIQFDTESRKPSLDGKRCVGCHLCMLVCPVGAITPANRIPKRK